MTKRESSAPIGTQSPDERLVVIAEKVISADGSPPFGPARIAMTGGRIDAIGSPDSLAIHEGDRVVTLPGNATLLPGLVNSHVHLTVDPLITRRPLHAFEDTESDRLLGAVARLGKALEAGITTMRDTGAADRSLFSLRDMVNRGELLGPRIFSSGAILCCTGGHASVIGHEADGADGMRKAARSEIKAGADFLKLMVDGGTSDRAIDIGGPSLTHEEIASAVDVAHRLGKRITAHAIAPSTIAAAIDAGVDSIEHGYQLTRDLADRMAEHGIMLVPTLSVHEAALGGGDRSLPWSDVVERSRDFSRAAVGHAVALGVVMAAGTDGGSPFNNHENLVGELLLMAAAGMPPLDVVESATRVGAELLGMSDRFGMLRPGLLADVIAVNGDPLSDLQSLRNPILVIKEGHVVHNQVEASVLC